MKVYGDLTVRGEAAALERFLGVLDGPLANGWSRQRQREIEVGRQFIGRIYCFDCSAQANRPASQLWMATRRDGSLYVSNILPQEMASFSHDQYNAILQDFAENCARPASEVTGVVVQVSNFDPRLEDFLSPQTSRLLRSFSSIANRSFLHSADRHRWNAFLTAAYRENAQLDPDMLKRWLVEEEHWPEDRALDLATEYQHARDLLGVYESQQV